MGLAEESQERSKIIDLDSLGISKDPTTNELYSEVYNMMIGENERFKQLFQSLNENIRTGTKPLIITEGKTDIQHIRKAMEKLKITDCDVAFHESGESFGETKLKILLDNISKVHQSRIIIGIFDRDVPSTVAEIENNGQKYKDYGNNVYAFCLPIPEKRKEYKNISIEFYYDDAMLKKERDDKCLYFDNEIYFNQKRDPISPIQHPEDNFEKKIWAKDVGDLDWIHSKSVFADLVEKDDDFCNDFDFSNFRVIFDLIVEIINSNRLKPH